MDYSSLSSKEYRWIMERERKDAKYRTAAGIAAFILGGVIAATVVNSPSGLRSELESIVGGAAMGAGGMVAYRGMRKCLSMPSSEDDS